MVGEHRTALRAVCFESRPWVLLPYDIPFNICSIGARRHPASDRRHQPCNETAARAFRCHLIPLVPTYNPRNKVYDDRVLASRHAADGLAHAPFSPNRSIATVPCLANCPRAYRPNLSGNSQRQPLSAVPNHPADSTPHTHLRTTGGPADSVQPRSQPGRSSAFTTIRALAADRPHSYRSTRQAAMPACHRVPRTLELPKRPSQARRVSSVSAAVVKVPESPQTVRRSWAA